MEKNIDKYATLEEIIFRDCEFATGENSSEKQVKMAKNKLSQAGVYSEIISEKNNDKAE